jgi:hypothetical protein
MTPDRPANSPQGNASNLLNGCLGLRMRLWIWVFTLCSILILGPVSSHATPIKVDLRKLLDQAETTQPFHYVPARAGWNGPEKPPISITSPVLPQQDAEVRRWLVRLSIPDPFMVLAFTVAIFGLRMLRRLREDRLGAATA